MELYENIIKDTIDLLSPYKPLSLEVSDKFTWETIQKNQLILKKESAFELGGSYKPAVNYQCVTTTNDLVPKDEILLYGKDLKEINEDTSFGRLVFLQINNLNNDEVAYKAIKDLEFIKYNIKLNGYMMRASTMDKREQVRVGKIAISNGISFKNIGNMFINNYKENPLVKAVKIIFITCDLPIFKELIKNAGRVDDITITLNHALMDMNIDCNSCNLEEICDEVEGMRELHFKNFKLNN